MAGPVLEARGIHKAFGRNQVLRGVDLEVASGGNYALFGPNGSGKTTLVRILSGLLHPDRGEVRIFGEPLERDRQPIRARIGVLSHEPYLYSELTAIENLVFFGRLYSVEDVHSRARELLKEVGLYTRSHDKAGTFSRGMKQRLGLARALLHDPDLVLLDEPYTGLDLKAQDILDSLVRERMAQGKAFLTITHDLSQGLGQATRAGILSGGRLILEASPEEWDRFKDTYREVMRGFSP